MTATESVRHDGGTAPAGHWRRLLDVARRDDWRTALTAAHSGLDALPVGPGGHALVPHETERAAVQVWLGGEVRERRPGTETVRDSPVPGLVVVRADTGRARSGPTGWETGLAGLRLGLSHRLLDLALERLGGRRSGDTALLQQQMVKGQVADVVVDHLEIRAALDAAGRDGLPWPTAVDVHRRITGADRALLWLFGAYGFAQDGPGFTAYVSELLADAYAGPSEWEVTE